MFLTIVSKKTINALFIVTLMSACLKEPSPEKVAPSGGTVKIKDFSSFLPTFADGYASTCNKAERNALGRAVRQAVPIFSIEKLKAIRLTELTAANGRFSDTQIKLLREEHIQYANAKIQKWLVIDQAYTDYEECRVTVKAWVEQTNAIQWEKNE